MSKSDISIYSRIMLNDDALSIEQKIKKAKTDPKPFPNNINDAKSRPEAFNLINIYAATNDKEIEEVIKEYADTEFSRFKVKLSESLISVLEPINLEIKRLLSDTNYLDSIIKNGANNARKIAQPVINEVYEKIGFLIK